MSRTSRAAAPITARPGAPMAPDGPPTSLVGRSLDPSGGHREAWLVAVDRGARWPDWLTDRVVGAHLVMVVQRAEHDTPESFAGRIRHVVATHAGDRNDGVSAAADQLLRVVLVVDDESSTASSDTLAVARSLRSLRPIPATKEQARALDERRPGQHLIVSRSLRTVDDLALLEELLSEPAPAASRADAGRTPEESGTRHRVPTQPSPREPAMPGQATPIPRAPRLPSDLKGPAENVS